MNKGPNTQALDTIRESVKKTKQLHGTLDAETMGAVQLLLSKHNVAINNHEKVLIDLGLDINTIKEVLVEVGDQAGGISPTITVTPETSASDKAEQASAERGAKNAMWIAIAAVLFVVVVAGAGWLAVESAFSKQRADIVALQSAVAGLSTKVTSLETDLKEQKAAVAQLKTKQAQASGVLAQFRTDLNTTLANATGAIEKSKAELAGLQIKLDTGLASAMEKVNGAGASVETRINAAVETAQNNIRETFGVDNFVLKPDLEIQLRGYATDRELANTNRIATAANNKAERLSTSLIGKDGTGGAIAEQKKDIQKAITVADNAEKIAKLAKNDVTAIAGTADTRVANIEATQKAVNILYEQILGLTAAQVRYNDANRLMWTIFSNCSFNDFKRALTTNNITTTRNIANPEGFACVLSSGNSVGLKARAEGLTSNEQKGAGTSLRNALMEYQRSTSQR